MNMDINRLGDLKRRIIDAMEVIGRPANIKEIAEEVGENRPIHSRISELMEAGWIVKIHNPAGLTHYSLRESAPVQDGGSPSPARSSKPEPDSQVSPSAQGSSSETVAQEPHTYSGRPDHLPVDRQLCRLENPAQCPRRTVACARGWADAPDGRVLAA